MGRQLREILAGNLKRRMDSHPEVKGRQENLEDRAGVGQATISRILNRQAATSVDVLEKLARALDCQAWELLVDGPEAYEEAVRRVLGRGV